MSSATEKYLDDIVHNSTEFETCWDEIRTFYNKKLWHQITNVLLDCLKDPVFQSKHNLKDMYDSFISTIASKIKPLSLAEIGVYVSEFVVKTSPENAIAFMHQIKEITTSCIESQILCDTVIGMIYLKALDNSNAAREIVENTAEKVAQIDGVTSVHPRYFQLSALYYQKLGKHAEYYREGLKYLGCANLETLTLQEKQNWAFSVGLAALLGEGIYNFGELLTHEIFESLKDSPNAWLIELIEGLSHGELRKLQELAPKWKTQVDLKAAESELLEKATVLCLIELMFRRPLNKRSIHFSEIAQATNVPAEKVEYLIMRALSLHLMEGRIDEINQSVTITWLQPRVLDFVQLESMYKQLGDWSQRVNGVRDLVEVDAKAILS